MLSWCYDAEFRYDRQPVGSLQGLDPARVIALGSVSKTLVLGFGNVSEPQISRGIRILAEAVRRQTPP